MALDAQAVENIEKRDGEAIAELIFKGERKIATMESEIKGLKTPWPQTADGMTFMEKWRGDLEDKFEERLKQEKADRDAEIEKKSAEIDELKNIIIRQNQGATSPGSGNSEEKCNRAFEKAIVNLGRGRNGIKAHEIKPDEQEAYIIEMKSDPYADPDIEQKAQNTLSYPHGGVLVMPPKMRAGIVDIAVQEPTNIGQFCQQENIPMESLEILQQPVHGLAGWQRELGDRTEKPDLELKAKKFSLNGCYTRYAITFEMLKWARVPILPWMQRDYAEGLGVLWGQAQINGDGIGKPLGLLNTPGIPTFQQGAATIADFNALKKMRYQIKSPYRGGLRWVMSRLVRAELDIIQDESKRYYLGDDVSKKSGEMLFDFPITFSEDMPLIAANAKPILLGNFSRSCVSITSSSANVMIQDKYTQATQGIIKYYMFTHYEFGVFNTEPLIFLVMN